MPPLLPTVNTRKRKYAPSGGMYAPPPRRRIARDVFTNLPVELLEEISSYFPPTITGLFRPTKQQLDLAHERRATLIALAGTCRYFRGVFLPCAYDGIQVLKGINQGNSKYLPEYKVMNPRVVTNIPSLAFAKELVRQVRVITHEKPELARYVRSVEVTILKSKPAQMIQQLLKCMKGLKNLRYVYINIVADSLDLKPIVSSYSFPQVERLKISGEGQRLIHAFPNLRRLGSAGGDFGGISYPYYRIHFGRLESLSIPFKDQYDFTAIDSDMPNLRTITFDYTRTLAYITTHGKEKLWPNLSKLKNLHNVIIRGLPEDVWAGSKAAVLDLVMDAWVVPVLEALRSIPTEESEEKQDRMLILRWTKRSRIFIA